LAGDEVKVTDVIPYTGTAGGSRLFLYVESTNSPEKATIRISNQTLQAVRVDAASVNTVESMAYDSATMKTLGLLFPSSTTVSFFTEDAAGTRTIRFADRALGFDFIDNLVTVTIGSNIQTAGTITAATSMEAVNPEGIDPGVVSSNNIDPAECVRLLDLSLATATNYSLRLTSNPPTDSANGTEITGGGYLAQTFQVNAAVSPGRKTPTADIVFPAPTATWPEIQGMEVWTTSSPARRWWKAMAPNERRTPQLGNSGYRIPAASMVFSLD
jgi:hypothetical protein